MAENKMTAGEIASLNVNIAAKAGFVILSLNRLRIFDIVIFDLSSILTNVLLKDVFISKLVTVFQLESLAQISVY